MLFLLSYNSVKFPTMIPLREPPGGFFDVGCCCCFILTGGFSFIAFRRHPSPFRELSPVLSLREYTHVILSAQLMAK